jgi:hypothetical protein
MAAGDLNRDGYADLAIGAPYDRVDGREDAGSVTVLYGSRRGLTATGDELVSQAGAVQGESQPHELFGYALAIADIGHGEAGDLAIGVPGGREGGSGGVVNVLHGSKHGIRTSDQQLWTSDDLSISERLAGGVGFALAAADLSGGEKAELAIGAPWERVGHHWAAGAVHVLRGKESGLTARGKQRFTRANPSVPGEDQPCDYFGNALAAGNFGRGTKSDLAIGMAPWEYDSCIGDRMHKQPKKTATHPWDGIGQDAVYVIYGGAKKLRRSGIQNWNQETPGIEGADNGEEEFGASLAAGQVGHGRQADLAIGAPGSAQVNVLYGSPIGLSAKGDQLWTQDSPGVEELLEADDNFGIGLAMSRRPTREGPGILVIGSSSDSSYRLRWAGVVNVLFATADGLRARADQLIRQHRPPE